MALLFDNTGAGNLTLKSPASGAYTLVFPTTAGSAGYYLQTDGSGNLLWAPGSSAMNDGLVTTPGLAFGADLDTGFYRPGDNILAVSTAGAEVARFASTGLTMAVGDVTLVAKPTSDLHAATKSYVDQAGTIVVTEATTSRVLALADAGKYIRTTNAGTVEITVPPQSSVVWEDNTEVHVEQGGTGQVIFTPGSGVTINRAGGTNAAVAEQYALVTLKRTGTDTWSLIGDLELSTNPAANVDFTPYGNIAAVNVQTAIQELDDEKLDASTAASTYLTQANAASSYVELSGDTMTGVLTSTVTTGTAPFTIASTTTVTNLNADMLDGNHAAAFATAAHKHPTLPVESSYNSANAPGAITAISSGFTLDTGLTAGTIMTIYNNSASSVTITQGSGVTLRLAGTTTTGDRTILARGMATICCLTTSEYIMTGSGVE